MGMSRAQMAAWRVSQQLRLGAASITLRRYVTRNSDEGEPLRNPPEIRGNLVVAAAAAAGDGEIRLSAGTLLGFLAPDDKLFIAGLPAPVTVADLAESAANEILVTLNEDLPAAVAAGVAVTPVYAADQPLLARVSEGPRLVEDGVLTNILSYQVKVSAFDVGVEPDPQWTVFLPTGSEHPIVAVKPNLVEGVPATYDIQVRQRG